MVYPQNLRNHYRLFGGRSGLWGAKAAKVWVSTLGTAGTPKQLHHDIMTYRALQYDPYDRLLNGWGQHPNSTNYGSHSASG